MGKEVEIKVPSAGESVTEGELTEWLKKEGDAVKVDEEIVVIETDKITVELPSPASGVLKKILAKEGETVTVDQVIGIIDADGEAAADSDKEQAEPEPKKADPAPEKQEEPASEPEKPEKKKEAPSEGDSIVSPAAKRLAEEKGIAAEKVEGTGKDGRVLKEDVQRHVEGGGEAMAKAEEPKTDKPQKPAPSATSGGPGREEQRVPLSRLRKRIAERLMESQHGTATLTTFNEIDMSASMAARKTHGEKFEKKYGIRLGFMSFFAKASIEALKEFPAINAEIDGSEIIYKNYYDIGVAVSTEKGLVVPIVRNAESLSFAETEKAIADLGKKARDGQLTVEDLTGGTFSISNGGVFGSLMSTPILNPPQSGILGLHKIEKRPVVVGDEIVIRPMMYVALSYDHRIVDGREAVSALVRIKECIEDPSRILLEV